MRLYLLAPFLLPAALVAFATWPADAYASGPAPDSRGTAASTHFVSPNGRGDYATIQSAVLTASDGDTILLDDGIFRGQGNRDIDPAGKEITIRSRSGRPEGCIIDCQGSEEEPHRGFEIRSGEGPGLVLEGITITNGWSPLGAAVYCAGSSPVIRNCRFQRNTSMGGGALFGGIWADPTVIDCLFLDNHSFGGGAAIRCERSSATVERCTFLRNRAEGCGGAVYLGLTGRTGQGELVPPWTDEELLAPRDDIRIRLQSCSFVMNESERIGGALHCSFASPIIESCVFAHNSPSDAATNTAFSYPEFISCCFFADTGEEPSGFLRHQIGINGNFHADPLLCGRLDRPETLGILPRSPCAPGDFSDHLIGAWPVRRDAPHLRVHGDRGRRPLQPSSRLLEQRSRFWEIRHEYIKLRNLGWSSEIRGAFLEAEACFRQLVTLLQRGVGADHTLTAEALEDLAYVLGERGNLGEAEEIYESSLASWRDLGALAPRLAMSRLRLADVQAKQHRLDEAEANLRLTVEAFRRPDAGSYSVRAGALRKLGEILLNRGHTDEAEKLLAESVSLLTDGHRHAHSDLALSLTGLAQCARAKGRPEKALVRLEEALEHQRLRFPSDHPLISLTLTGMADCCLEMRRYAEAESLLLQAASIYESARLRGSAGLERASFLDSPYHHLAAARLRLNDLDGAWEAAELGQGRALWDLMIAPVSGGALSHKESAVMDSLQQELSDLDARLPALQRALPEDVTGEVAERLEETWLELHEARGAWSAFQNRAILRPLPPERPATLEQIQETLVGETALIGWIHVELSGMAPISAAYLVRREGPVRWIELSEAPRSGEPEDPMSRINRYRDALMTPRAPKDRETAMVSIEEDAHAIWMHWLAPVLSECKGIRHLVIVLSGPLLGIPVESLVDAGGNPMATAYSISYAPSATIYSWLKGRPPIVTPGAPRRALLVGDPPFAERHLAAMIMAEEAGATGVVHSTDPDLSDPQTCPGDVEPAYDEWYLRGVLSGNTTSLESLPRLPWTRLEVSRLDSLLPDATCLVGPAATEQALMEMARTDRLRRFDTIHLATHALVNDDRPERSALVLSLVGLPDPLAAMENGERVYDGLLTAADVMYEFHLDADLTTLSACRTALGRRTPGDGFVGLAASFLKAGTRSLLASLWRVDDEATSLLMARFYENLVGSGPGSPAGPMPKADALQEAKCWLRSLPDARGSLRYRHPSCWAGFVLIGDDGPAPAVLDSRQAQQD